MRNHTVILGAGGFIGRHLVNALAPVSKKLTALVRHPIDFGYANVETVTGEFKAPEDFSAVLTPGCDVVHLASVSTPGSSAGKPTPELQGNIQITTALLEALQNRSDAKLLYMSSGGSLYSGNIEGEASESSPVNPRSYHGAGKFASEWFISAWCQQYEATATALRPSNIYGPGQPERAGFGIIPAALGKTIRGEMLPIWGDGTTVRDYLYIDDLISLCLKIVESPMPRGFSVLNAGSGLGISLNELLDLVEKVTRMPLTRQYTCSRVVDAKRVVLDNNLARSRYGWMPATTIARGLEQTWNSYRLTHR
ncbi:NAD-dependent epimerase/dehydratase family protein [Dyella mobilis]|uniref:NAD-dependent epimerase/dehydratase family protein n=1 Tax=Dyella mobilis TaxID=1849582 RepID=A0ABS2KGQ3_9GAMM|nr:NAD-dependent epimerase/dehydratase family protein [Dyella mobilis]MBM7130060.1 NAD-dependent epimerase/dehydratase family protein [Dyella mobilis]GLQ96685.1 epimerase [Dyella mobilis]